VTEEYSRKGGNPYDGNIGSVTISTGDDAEELDGGNLLEAMLAQH
jgi:hypothetical protein